MGIDSVELGLRIARARQRAGFTQDQLGKDAGLDRSAIAKVETGVRRITALELARVAQSLNERVEWFVSEAVPSVIAYRNTVDPGVPSAQIDGALDRISRFVEFLSEHDSALHASLAPIPHFVTSEEGIATEEFATWARGLLKADSDGPLYDLSARLADVGVLSFSLELGDESADAGSLLLPRGALALINGSLRTGRRRLALAHELGHILLADEYSVDRRVDSATTEGHERTLDRFARALLLPPLALLEQWRRWGGENSATVRSAAVRTASHFRVDMSTLAGRLRELDAIDKVTASRIRDVHTQRADIVEFDLLVADELAPTELPRLYEAAVLRLHHAEITSTERSLELLLGSWTEAELPSPPLRDESEIWQFVS